MNTEEEEAEFKKRLADNEAWNQQIANERNQRLQKELEELKKIALNRIELAKERQEERKREIEEVIKQEKVFIYDI